MKDTTKNKLNEIGNNLETLKKVARSIGTLFMSIEGYKVRHIASTDEAIKEKEKAEEYLKKFGEEKIYSTVRMCYDIIDEIKEEEGCKD